MWIFPLLCLHCFYYFSESARFACQSLSQAELFPDPSRFVETAPVSWQCITHIAGRGNSGYFREDIDWCSILVAADLGTFPVWVFNTSSCMRGATSAKSSTCVSIKCQYIRDKDEGYIKGSSFISIDCVTLTGTITSAVFLQWFTNS